MTINIKIMDATGTKTGAFVTPNGELCVTFVGPTLPVQGTSSRARFFSGLAGSTGVDSGTTNQNVDGSATFQEFYLSSHPDYDIRIMAIVIVIADTLVFHNNFGNISALTNGWDLKLIEAGEETFLINKAKTGGQAIAQAGFSHGYGDGATSFELLNWTGTEDAQTIVFPAHILVPDGIRIGRGTKDKLVSVVNDDLTGLTDFTVRVLGYRHYF